MPDEQSGQARLCDDCAWGVERAAVAMRRGMWAAGMIRSGVQDACAEASRARLMHYLQTTFVALRAYLLLGEGLHAYDLTGTAIIVAGLCDRNNNETASGPPDTRPQHAKRFLTGVMAKRRPVARRRRIVDVGDDERLAVEGISDAGAGGRVSGQQYVAIEQRLCCMETPASRRSRTFGALLEKAYGSSRRIESHRRTRYQRPWSKMMTDTNLFN
jgi:hypothetical protein